jgi:RNA binding exosome subunit
MITVEKVIKENGELSITRKQSFEVADHNELERERTKLERHYGCKVYFVRKEKQESPAGEARPS